jgi:hypothetical protein
MSTGNRCAIYDDIGALSEARTIADLVRRLQPILNELAYYGVTGETAVLEAHEEWRSQYNDSLRAESGGAAAPPAHVLDSARARPATSSGSRAREPEPHGSREPEPRGSREPRESRASRDAREPDSRDARAPQRPLRLADLEYEGWAPAARPAPGRPAPGRPASDRTHTPAVVNSSGVPRALLSIMSGAHPSFRD